MTWNRFTETPLFEWNFKLKFLLKNGKLSPVSYTHLTLPTILRV